MIIIALFIIFTCGSMSFQLLYGDKGGCRAIAGVYVCNTHTHTHTHTRIDYQALHVLSGKQLLDIADLEFVHF